MTYTLYGHPGSGHACKVALALRLGGLDHETRFVDINAPRDTRPADFLAASPLGQVPLLVMGRGETMVQSGAILQELGRRHGILGGDTQAGLDRAREIIVWEANRIGMAIPQLISETKGGDAALTAAVPWLRARFLDDAEMFVTLLGDAPFLHGSAPGLGDICVWGYTSRLPEAALEAPAPLAGWLSRMAALPGMATPEELFPGA